ncbi:MAG: SDR family NAD(P)-dependent oxidoreductase [Chlamydiales bacterium]
MSKKTVLITGCSSGIGEATAQLFDRKEWNVISTSRTGHGMMKLDVRSSEDRLMICEYIKTKCEGRLDCLINNAGYGLMGLIDSLSDEQIRDVMETNVLGAVFLTRDLLPALRKAKGKVLSISSIFGTIGYPLGSAYCMSKYALNGAMESLRHELSWSEIQVGIIIPGTHKTHFGENMKLGVCTESFFKFRQQLRESKKTLGPEVVAQIAFKLANKNNIPFKTYVGNEEKLLKYLCKFLPDNFFQWILGKISTRQTK